VLNAYLLRRGLGHFGAWKKLRRIRSRPSNFEQWWSIRKYGRKAGVLKGRTPTLEHRHYADLQPFLEDYRHLAEMVEAAVRLAGIDQRCGREHDLCCCVPVCMSLAEAAYLLNRLNKALSRSQREQAIARAAQTDRQEDRILSELRPGGSICFSRRSEYRCPLWVAGSCILYQDRPLQCRTFELDPEHRAGIWDSELHPGLTALSRDVYQALSGTELPDQMPTFSISCVVSGRYVQEFFHLLKAT
jgi:Fe-S-cluster containining protein